MKERGLLSPNRGDALALTFAEPVVKRVTPIGSYASHMAIADYDPPG